MQYKSYPAGPSPSHGPLCPLRTNSKSMYCTIIINKIVLNKIDILFLLIIPITKQFRRPNVGSLRKSENIGNKSQYTPHQCTGMGASNTLSD